MIGRNSMGHASRVLLVLLAFGFFFGTYNLLAIIIHKKASYLGILGADRLEDPVIQRPEKAENPKYHVALTATDAPHSQWQCRMMYYWYNKCLAHFCSIMGFLFAATNYSDLNSMLYPGQYCPKQTMGFLCNGWRKQQSRKKNWFYHDQCKCILMAEPDNIFANPLPNMARGNNPAGFPFFYVKPTENEKIIRKFYAEEKGPVTDVDPIGNSPVIKKKIGNLPVNHKDSY
ncbi:hypothetical protein C1H46_012528 [Malus baccata]|uniref:Hydroxyproline O-arabinosyltransferase-like domain-containing protein n=1 Tax=Malus baccata TaxID=106549 RepID=A0A540MSY2_MALBA|nr:hypothetical protein C1H46_012528 [Malus baccata]